MAADADTPQYEQFRFDYDVAASAVAPVLEHEARVANLLKSGSASDESTHAIISGLRERQAEARDAIEKVAVARGSAKVVAYSAPDVAAHGKEIVAAIKQIAAWERQLLKFDTAAGKAIEAQFRRLDGFNDAESAFEKAVAGLNGELALFNESLPSIQEALGAIHAKAERCVEARDANGLSLAQGDADALAVGALQKALPRLQDWNAKAEAAFARLSGESRLRVGRGFGALKQRCQKLGPEVDALVARQRAVRAMKAAPVDVAKALKALGLGAAHKAALAKALAVAPAARAKALGALAKEAGLAADGRELLASLQKAGVI